MSFKVLENNGTLTTASDGITINKLNQHNKNGIIRGRLNDLAITYSSNTLNVAEGHIIISGINLVLEDSTSFTIAPVSVETTKYLIVEIVAQNDGITAELQVVNQYSDGSLDFTSDTITGTYRCLIANLTVDSSGIIEVNRRINYLEENHLYEHNIVISENNIATSDNIITFRVLSNNPVAMSEDEVATLLYNRGNNGIGTCITASGRAGDDSFEYVTSIDIDWSEHDIEYSYGYCDTIIIGVYGTNASELMFVVIDLSEAAQNKVYSMTYSGDNWHDTVVQIF